MALDISQLMAVSYPAVANEANKPENQFKGNAYLDFLRKKGGIKTVSWGDDLELTLDYQRNQGAEFIATDISSTSLQLTDVLTAAKYGEGQIIVPITWSFAQEAKNNSETKKVEFVASLIENALVSHDDLLEQALFTTNTNGFLGLVGVLPDNGQGSPGGIDAGTETWWRHFTSTFYDDGSDIVAKLTIAMKTAAKGSGGQMPNLISTGAITHSLYEGTQQPLIRYESVETADSGFKALKFMTADVIFSQHADDDRIHGIHTRNTKLYMAKGAARRMGKEIEITNQPGRSKKLYTMCQFATNNKSRNFVLTETAAPSE